MMSIIQKIEKQIKSFKPEDLVRKRWQEPGLSQETRNLYWAHMPATKGYFSELNPSFVFEYSSIQSMGTFPFILLRDGFYGLSYFFLKNPKPICHFNTQILVPARYECLIPKKWENNILLYEFEFNENNKDYKNGIIYGLATQDSFLQVGPKSKLENSLKKETNIFFNSFCRDRYFGESESHKSFFFEFQKEIYKKFGFDIKQSFFYNEMDWNRVNTDWAFYNIDEDNFLVYSDYLTFLYASKGATFVNKPKLFIKDSDVIERVQLSPYHSLKIGKTTKLENTMLQMLIKLKLSGTGISLHKEDFYLFLLDEFKAYLNSK